MAGPPDGRSPQPWPAAPPYQPGPQAHHSSPYAPYPPVYPPHRGTPGAARPWARSTLLLVVWGWTMLWGPLVAMLVAILGATALGFGLAETRADLAASDPTSSQVIGLLATASAGLFVVLATVLGLGTAFFTGLVGGVAAAAVLGRMPASLVGLISGLAAATAVLAVPVGTTLQSDDSILLRAAAVPAALVLVTVGIIAWRAARRARPAGWRHRGLPPG